jgi:hypothetical protein
MSPIDALRNYFDAMVTHRISSIVNMLARLQNHLLTNKDKMTLEEMDSEIDRLEDIKRALRRHYTRGWMEEQHTPVPNVQVTQVSGPAAPFVKKDESTASEQPSESSGSQSLPPSDIDSNQS